MRQQSAKRHPISRGLHGLCERNKSNHERRYENELGGNGNLDFDSRSGCDTAWMDWLGNRG